MRTPTTIGRFSNFTTEEIAIAKRNATSFVFRLFPYYNPFRRFNYDARTRTGMLSSYYVSHFLYTKKINEQAIFELQKKRHQSRTNREFQNIYQNKLVYDYFKHFDDIRYIYDGHIAFNNGRNHYAKNEQDIKILQILKKHFINKKNK